jgi:hypothetical protein
MAAQSSRSRGYAAEGLFREAASFCFGEVKCATFRAAEPFGNPFLEFPASLGGELDVLEDLNRDAQVSCAPPPFIPDHSCGEKLLTA